MMAGALALGALMAAAVVGPGSAQTTRVEARFTAKLAGLPIGNGVWVLEVSEDQYSIAATGRSGGVLAAFASGEGTGAARGRIRAGQLLPANYNATISANKKSEEIRIALQNGVVRDVAIEPAQPDNPNRLPVTDAHKKGVMDPMTASLVRVAGTDDPLGPAACASSAAVFDGRMRYDLQLRFKRMDTVKAEQGSKGPAVVCTVLFTPVAGYVPGRVAIKYLAAQRDMEVWFVPVAGTRLIAPFKVSIPTPLGTGTLEATQFMAQAAPRVTPASAKAQ
jgi:hypothetical protein